MIAMSFVLEIRTKTTAKPIKKVASIYPSLFCGEAFFSGNPCISTNNSEVLLDLFWGNQNCWVNRRCLFFLQQKQKRHQPKKASSEVVHHSWKSIKFLFFQPPPKKKRGGEWKNTSILWPPRKTSWFPSILRCAFTSSFGLATWLPLPSASFRLWTPGDWHERFCCELRWTNQSSGFSGSHPL